MARGWESKSVEQQIEERAQFRVPVSGDNAHANAAVARQIEVLELSRKHLINEMEGISNPRLLVLKQRALRHVEAQMAALGETPR
jgi:hypothetical protein